MDALERTLSTLFFFVLNAPEGGNSQGRPRRLRHHLHKPTVDELISGNVSMGSVQEVNMPCSRRGLEVLQPKKREEREARDRQAEGLTGQER